MHTTKNRASSPSSTVALGLFAGISAAAAQGCDRDDNPLGDGPLGDLAEQCGLSCPAEGILEGNASISGIASLDAFFGAVVDVQTSAANVRGSMRAELDALAVSVGLERGAAAAEVRAAIEAKIAASVSGGLKVEYQPAQCTASVEVTARAAAECDASVDPGEVSVKCEGKCTAEASAEAQCTGEAQVVCEGTAPNLACEGTCTGTCQLDVAASCEGTCRGTCEGECSVQDASGQCAGECMGTCQGTCELEAGGSCSGQCQGECEWTPPSGSCDAGVTASCQAMADASVDCSGQCEGKAEPPMVKAECEASVEAKANASVDCRPPSLAVRWQWSAELEGNAQAQAEFKAWVENFKLRFANMIAASAKAELVLQSGELLVSAAGGVVSEVAGEIAAEGDFAAKVKAGCAVAELENVGTALSGAVADMQASAEIFAEISGSVGG